MSRRKTTCMLDREYGKGDEVCTSYGEHSNDFLLAEYGFLLQNNANDRFDPDDLISSRFSLEETALLKQMKTLAALDQLCGPATPDEGRVENTPGAIDHVRLQKLLAKFLEEIKGRRQDVLALDDGKEGYRTLLLQRWDQIDELALRMICAMSTIVLPVLAPPPRVDSLWEQAIQRYQQDSNHVIPKTDECPEINRDKLLPCLKALQDSVRLFVTSRLSVDLTGKLSNIVRINVRAHDSDVRAFISAKLASGATRISRALANDDKMEDTIIDQSNGMFLLAHFQLEHVCSQRSLTGVRKALSSHTPDVNQFYDNSIERLKQLAPVDSDFALKALCYVFCAHRQLSMDELLHALAIVDGDEDFDDEAIDDEQVFQSLLHGLVRIEGGTRLVSLVHLTLHEYLRTHSNDLPAQYEKQLSTACLTYLSFNTCTSGPCDDAELMSQRLETYCFHDYASRYWAAHTVAHAHELMEQIVSFLQSDGNLGAAVQNCLSATSSGESLLSGSGESDIDVKDSHEMTPLLLSARCGHVEATERLLALEANVEAQNDKKETALLLAAKHGHASVVKVLVEYGANQAAVDDELLSLNGREKGSQKRCRFWLRNVINSGWTSRLLVLLEDGADIDAIDEVGGSTALTHAAWLKADAMVSLLLDHGADVNLRDLDDRTALHWAAEGTYADLVEALLDHGAEIDCRVNGWTPLLLAGRKWDELGARILVQRGADLNARDFHGRSVLHWFAIQGCAETVPLLLRSGASVDMQDYCGQTALHWAVASGHAATARRLLKRNASAALPTNDGSTALHIAAYIGYLKMVHLLLSDKERRERRAATASASQAPADLGVVDLAATDANGFTSQTVAELAGYWEVADVLREAAGGAAATDCNGSCHGPAQDKFHRPKPRLRVSTDPESDYAQTKDGISTVGIRLMSHDVQLWLYERSKLVPSDGALLVL
ncbi:hypothetical protein MY3296_002498 [Beauveria thailandica]